MRKVKCRVTGEIGDSCDFYKSVDGKYYKNEEVYKEQLVSNEYKKKIIALINSKILNKNIGNCAGFIGKLITESGLEPKTIYDSISEKLDYIKEILKTSNESDQSKIYAIFTISTKYYEKVTYAGCYEIRNNKTNEVYIGESIDLFKRFTTHISELYENKHHCKRLQESFNEMGTISCFTISPLFMFPIVSIDKNEIKHETLYLESAFYLIYKNNNENLYNTVNPYVTLKNNSVSLDKYSIDCNKILNLLISDKYNVVPNNISQLIKDDLKTIIDDQNKNLNTVQQPKENNVSEDKNLITNENLYRITNILKEFVNDDILPIDYDYSKIRKILVDNNLITIDPVGHTVATEYSLNNKLYIIDKERIIKGVSVYNYFISEKGKQHIKNIFMQYENKSKLSKTS